MQVIDFQPLDFQPEGPPLPAPPNVRVQSPKNTLERFEQDHPDGVQVMGQPIIPAGLLTGAAKVAGPGIKAVANKVLGILSKPGVGATIGAAEGYRNGGDLSSTVIGGITGATVSSQLRGARGGATASRAVHPVAEKMSQAAPTKSADEMGAQAMARINAILDDVKARPIATSVAKPPTAPPAAAQPSTLVDELMKRQINWRTTDAVPIDAIKRDISQGGTILESGESMIGLSERLARAMKNAATDPKAAAEAEMLARAIRQRMHIGTDKAGLPRKRQ